MKIELIKEILTYVENNIPDKKPFESTLYLVLPNTTFSTKELLYHLKLLIEDNFISAVSSGKTNDLYETEYFITGLTFKGHTFLKSNEMDNWKMWEEYK